MSPRTGRTQVHTQKVDRCPDVIRPASRSTRLQRALAEERLAELRAQRERLAQSGEAAAAPLQQSERERLIRLGVITPFEALPGFERKALVVPSDRLKSHQEAGTWAAAAAPQQRHMSPDVLQARQRMLQVARQLPKGRETRLIEVDELPAETLAQLGGLSGSRQFPESYFHQSNRARGVRVIDKEHRSKRAAVPRVMAHDVGPTLDQVAQVKEEEDAQLAGYSDDTGEEDEEGPGQAPARRPKRRLRAINRCAPDASFALVSLEGWMVDPCFGCSGGEEDVDSDPEYIPRQQQRRRRRSRSGTAAALGLEVKEDSQEDEMVIIVSDSDDEDEDEDLVEEDLTFSQADGGFGRASRARKGRSVPGRDEDDWSEERYEARVDQAMLERAQQVAAALQDTGEDLTKSIELDGGFKVPMFVYSRLYDYQRTGVKWLWELYCQRAGGIVGDEMVSAESGHSSGLLVPRGLYQLHTTSLSAVAPGARQDDPGHCLPRGTPALGSLPAVSYRLPGHGAQAVAGRVSGLGARVPCPPFARLCPGRGRQRQAAGPCCAPARGAGPPQGPCSHDLRAGSAAARRAAAHRLGTRHSG